MATNFATRARCCAFRVWKFVFWWRVLVAAAVSTELKLVLEKQSWLLLLFLAAAATSLSALSEILLGDIYTIDWRLCSRKFQV